MTFGGVPASAVILRIAATIGGVAVRDSEDLLATATQLSYTLDSGASGTFAVDIRAIDGASCAPGSGHGETLVDGSQASYSLAVDLTTQDPALCPFSVRKSGTGTVSSDPAGIACGTQCAIDVPSGTSLILSASPGGRGYFAGWSGACAGYAPCALTIDRALSVGADFFPELCSSANVCWESPLPAGFDLYGVYGAHKDDLWAVGEGGQILHYDGSAFTQVSSPSRSTLRAIWGSGPSDVWAAGLASTLVHYDGNGWSSAAAPSGATSDLYAIAGSDENDVWAAGAAGTLYHYDGHWSTVNSGVTYDLTGVYASSEQVVLIGSGGQVIKKSDDRFIAIGTNPAPLHGISGTADDDIITVGDNGTMQRWDGSSLQKQSGYPGPYMLRAVYARTASDGWVAGSAGTLLRWDGSNLTRLNVPTSQAFEAVFSPASDDAWAVGDRGTIVHFDGTRVTPYGSSGTPDASDYRGVSGTSANDLWAVGNNNSIVHYDGNGWLPVSSGQPSTVNWRGVYALGPSDVWVAGNDGVSGAAVIVKWNGTSYAALPAPASVATLTAVSSSSIGNVWIGGSGGTIWRWNGSSFSTWSAVTPELPQINAVAAVSASEVWFGGAPTQDTLTAAIVGCVLHFDGNGVTLVRGLPAVTLTAAAVAASGDIWFAGYDASTPARGIALRIQNGALGSFRDFGGIYPALYGVGVRSGSDVWVSGANGTLLHATDGMNFAPIVTGLPSTVLYGIAPAGAASMSIVGSERTILRVLQ